MKDVCEECDGEGHVMSDVTRSTDWEPKEVSVVCPECDGTGEQEQTAEQFLASIVQHESEYAEIARLAIMCWDLDAGCACDDLRSMIRQHLEKWRHERGRGAATDGSRVPVGSNRSDAGQWRDSTLSEAGMVWRREVF